MSDKVCACGAELLEVYVESGVVWVEKDPVLAVKLDQKVHAGHDGNPLPPPALFLTGKVVPVFGPHSEGRCEDLREQRAEDAGLALPPKSGLVLPE